MPQSGGGGLKTVFLSNIEVPPSPSLSMGPNQCITRECYVRKFCPMLVYMYENDMERSWTTTGYKFGHVYSNTDHSLQRKKVGTMRYHLHLPFCTSYLNFCSGWPKQQLDIEFWFQQRVASTTPKRSSPSLVLAF